MTRLAMPRQFFLSCDSSDNLFNVCTSFVRSCLNVFFIRTSKRVLNFLALKMCNDFSKNDNFSEKEKFWLAKLQVLEIIIRILFKHYFNTLFILCYLKESYEAMSFS